MPDVRTLTLREELHIAAPPDRVWDVFQDVRAWPEWNPVCLRVWDVSPSLWQIGSSFSFTLRMAGRPVSFRVTVTESRPPYEVRWSSRRFTITGTRTVEFEASGAGTRASDTKVFRSSVLPLWLFYPRPIIRRMSQTSLLALKQRIEGA